MPSTKPFSAITFFDHFKTALKVANDSPLTPDKLTIQGDLLAEIADEDKPDLGFAYIGIDHPTSNKTLLFSLTLYRGGIGLTVGLQEVLFCDYEKIAKNEKQAAEKMIDLLKAFSNGQIALLLTYVEGGDERIQAAEVLYRQLNETRYKVLYAYPMFEPASRLRGKEYNTSVKKNGFDFDDVKIDVGLLRIVVHPGNPSDTRTRLEGLHSPFTFEMWKQTIDAYNAKKAEKIADKVEKKLNKAFGTSSSESPSFKQAVRENARLRHAELRWIALIIAVFTLFYSVDIFTVALTVACALGTIALPWKNLKRPWPWSQVVVSYGLFVAVIPALLMVQLKDIFWWIMVGVAAWTIIECAAWDIRMLYKKRQNKSNSSL